MWAILAPISRPDQSMNSETAAAVSALVKALQADPAALHSMKSYGNIPEHLVDFLEDHEHDLDLELK